MAVWRLLPWCFVWTLLLATLAWTQSDEMGSAVIVVLPSQSSVETRVGCQVTICCQGTGQSIQWTPFGQRDPIVNGTDGILIKETRIDESESVDDVVLISKLTYPSIGEEHRGALTCSIDRGPGVNAVTRTYLIFIDPAPIALTVSNVNISGYAITEPLTISCFVDTCASGVEVEFFKEDQSLGMGTLSSTAPSVYNTVVTVDEDTPGSYGCRVITTISSVMATELFNVTGTPLPAPVMTDTPVTMVATGTGGSDDGTGTGGTRTTMQTTTASALGLAERPLLLPLLLLALLYAVWP